MAALNVKYTDLVKFGAGIGLARFAMGATTIGSAGLFVVSTALWIAPAILMILFTGFFATWLLTKLIYLVVPRTSENRWTVNTWLSIAWFLPAFYIWTSVAVATLTLIFFPPYAMVQIVAGHYDATNLILAAYGDLMWAATNHEITYTAASWKFLVFDTNSPILMTIRVAFGIASFFYLRAFGAYHPGKEAFMDQEKHGESVSLTFEF